MSISSDFLFCKELHTTLTTVALSAFVFRVQIEVLVIVNVSVRVQRVVTTSSSALTAGVSQNAGSVILTMIVETGLMNKTAEVLLAMSSCFAVR